MPPEQSGGISIVDNSNPINISHPNGFVIKATRLSVTLALSEVEGERFSLANQIAWPPIAILSRSSRTRRTTEHPLRSLRVPPLMSGRGNLSGSSLTAHGSPLLRAPGERQAGSRCLAYAAMDRRTPDGRRLKRSSTGPPSPAAIGDVGGTPGGSSCLPTGDMSST